MDQEGVALDTLVRARRTQKAAAETFLHRVVDGCGYCPRVVITGRPASYPPAVRGVRRLEALGYTVQLQPAA